MRAAIVLMFLLTAHGAQAAPQLFTMPSEYSAEMVFENEKGEKAIAKVFASHGNVRSETYIPNLNAMLVTIVRRDKDMVKLLNPLKKEFVEIPIAENFQSVEDLRAQAEWKFASIKKLLDGQEIEKYEGFVVCDEQRIQMIYWVDKKTKLPTRRSINGDACDFYNIRAGAQNEALFEIPENFKKLDSLSRFPQNKATIGIPLSQSQK